MLKSFNSNCSSTAIRFLGQNSISDIFVEYIGISSLSVLKKGQEYLENRWLIQTLTSDGFTALSNIKSLRLPKKPKIKKRTLCGRQIIRCAHVLYFWSNCIITDAATQLFGKSASVAPLNPAISLYSKALRDLDLLV
jgi:hypothetical protein